MYTSSLIKHSWSASLFSLRLSFNSFIANKVQSRVAVLGTGCPTWVCSSQSQPKHWHSALFPCLLLFKHALWWPASPLPSLLWLLHAKTEGRVVSLYNFCQKWCLSLCVGMEEKAEILLMGTGIITLFLPLLGILLQLRSVGVWPLAPTGNLDNPAIQPLSLSGSKVKDETREPQVFFS